jgi:hypothetical protein
MGYAEDLSLIALFRETLRKPRELLCGNSLQGAVLSMNETQI